jgi:hypothetical protein
MRRQHNFEYNEHKWSMIAQYIGTVVPSIVEISVDKLYTGSETNCNIPSDKKMKIFIYTMFFEMNVVLNFVAFVILYLKSSSDILQGISKVDYFVMVSRFQVDKIKRYNRYSVKTNDDRNLS